MAGTSAPGTPGRTLRLRTAFATAATSLLLERIWPPILFLLGLAAVFLILAWTGAFAALPGYGRVALLVLLALGLPAILWRHRHLRLPTRPEIVARIEASSRLDHQPLAVQAERPLGQDPMALALWRSHQRRMADRLRRLRGGAPNGRTEAIDPYGLRALLALGLVTAFAYSFGPGGGRIADALAPVEGTMLGAPRVDAWITPPGYTGRPPILLNKAARSQAVHQVPEGSVLSVRLSDAGGARLSFSPRGGGESLAIAPAEGDAASGAAAWEVELGTSGAVSLETRLRTLGEWSVAVVPDLAPLIEFDGEPQAARNGALGIAYRISDDYGAVSGTAEIAVPDAAAGARPLVSAPQIRLSMPRRGRGQASARTSINLVDSPYAGAQVSMTLTASDDAGQTGRSEPRFLTLPERPFANPLARAVVEQRRILALDANQARRVVQMLDAVTLRGDSFIERTGDLLALRVARSSIASARSDEELLWAVDFLWDIALGIEDGNLSVAERRLRDAQEALSDALEDGASEEEVAGLMEELRAAMQEYLQAMAEAMQNRPPQNQMQMGEMQEIRPQDLERMLDRIEDLARSGSPDAARQLLAELQEMMDNLPSMQAQQQGQDGGEQSPAQQQMNALGDMLQRQQELMDRTFELGREQARRQMQEGGMPQAPGEAPTMSPQEMEEAMRRLQSEQGELQQQLQAMQDEMEALGMAPGEGLPEAGEAMGQAEGALGQGDDGLAVARQGEAMAALRRGAQEMMSQMQAQGQGNQPQGQQGMGYGPGQQSSGRDPLGRERQRQGQDFGRDVDVPDEIDVQRARQILDQIRRRLGDRLSPQMEREYLERLLRTP